MEITDKRIDAGKAFDWGKTSEYYAKYRDIYPDIFYRKVDDRGLCVEGQSVLDLGTGTGVLPRNMYKYGAKWTGTDISPEQIEQAKLIEKLTDRQFKALSVTSLLKECTRPSELMEMLNDSTLTTNNSPIYSLTVSEEE